MVCLNQETFGASDTGNEVRKFNHGSVIMTCTEVCTASPADEIMGWHYNMRPSCDPVLWSWQQSGVHQSQGHDVSLDICHDVQ